MIADVKLPRVPNCFTNALPVIGFAILNLLFSGIGRAQTPPFRWAAKAGGAFDDFSRWLAVDASGNVCIAGAFHDFATFGDTTLASSGGYDIFVAKYDPMGELVWVQQAGGSLDDVGYGIAVDAAGNSSVTGYFKSPTATFGNLTLTNSASTNSPDIFVARYDSAGNLLWAKQAGGADADSGYAIAVDTASNSYLSGVFSGTASFGGVTLTNSQGAGHFMAKYNSAGGVSWAKKAGG